MCGFALLQKKKNFGLNNKKFFQSTKFLSHRGPDDNHHYIDESILANFYRLSIFDLSLRGRQPMESFSGRYLILFNGAIYNKDELKNKINYSKLKSGTDTEILLNCFEKYKEKTLDFIDGMFSFVIYDKKTKNIFAARDRYGIKPLYYYENKSYTYFSSEIKPIINFKKKINISDYFSYQFLVNQSMDFDDKTFFENIKAVKPGEFIIFKKNSKKIKKKYWDLNPLKTDNNDDKIKTIKKIKYLFENSIKKHLKCDVDVGLFLSGGTDSTSIASVINKYHKKIRTFTYDFQNSDRGEGYIAKKIAKKLNFENLSYYLKPKDIENNIDKLTYVLESPFTSIRIIADHNLYKLCREKNVKVVLLGHGGDELLAGYDYNYLPYYVDKSIKDRNYDILANFENNSYLQTGKFIDKNNQNFSFFNQNQVTKDCMPFVQIENFNQDFINENSKKNHQINLNQNNFLKNSQLLDIKYINLPRSLKYADRLSMINGIEARVPFLDKDLSEYLFNLNNDYKIKNGISRWIFKEYVKKNINSKFLTKSKKSVVDPQRDWFKKDLKDFFLDTLNSSEFKSLDYFNYKEIIKNYSKLIKGEINTSFNIFQIITFFFFYKNFNNGKIDNQHEKFQK